jgi:hypothetical protein
MSIEPDIKKKLDEQFVTGKIDEKEYRRKLKVLNELSHSNDNNNSNKTTIEKCINCGAVNSKNDKKCISCGIIFENFNKKFELTKLVTILNSIVYYKNQCSTPSKNNEIFLLNNAKKGV